MPNPYVTGTTQLPDPIGKFYVRKILYEAKSYLVWYLFAQKTPYIPNNGNKVKWRRILKLENTPKRLEEGVTGTGQRITKRDMIATVYWYGEHILYSDQVKFETRDPILRICSTVLGVWAGEVSDKVLRNVYVAGTNVLYAADDAGTVTSARTSVAGRVSNEILDRAIRANNKNRVRKWKKSIPAGPGQGTYPIRDSWPAIIDSETLYDIEKFVSGFRAPTEYGQLKMLHESEQGAYKNLRFFLTDQPIIWADGGAATIPAGVEGTTRVDVHAIVIFGEDAVGAVRMGGENTPYEFNAFPPGSAGSADPNAQRGSAAVKFPQGGKILDETQLLRIEVAVSS